MTLSQKSLYLKSFNQLFFDFVNEIIVLFPENHNILQAKESFELFKKCNPTILIKCWFTNVNQPYRTQIMANDVQFFCEKDYDNDLCSLKNSKDIVKIIGSLRESVRNMSETSKLQSMKYIQQLCQLSELYDSYSN